MYSFISTMDFFAHNKMSQISSSREESAKRDFQIWQDSQNKHEVIRFYSNPDFGAYYTMRLYKSRVECFHEVLQTVSSDSDVKRVMMQNLNVISFGCGPGPEIAAYVAFLRSSCGVRSRISFRAVDKIGYWREFVNVAQNCDSNISIIFDNSCLDTSYLATIRSRGVCIMSYPESVNFGNIWTTLKSYFQLIIIIDQSKTHLHQMLSCANFKIMPVQYKGSKHCAYYVESSLNSTGSLPRLSARQYQPDYSYYNALAYEQNSARHNSIPQSNVRYGQGVSYGQQMGSYNSVSQSNYETSSRSQTSTDTEEPGLFQYIFSKCSIM